MPNTRMITKSIVALIHIGLQSAHCIQTGRTCVHWHASTGVHTSNGTQAMVRKQWYASTSMHARLAARGCTLSKH
eukprot:1159597-Pelagomonas_calceolata.AAC.18